MKIDDYALQAYDFDLWWAAIENDCPEFLDKESALTLFTFIQNKKNFAQVEFIKRHYSDFSTVSYRLSVKEDARRVDVFITDMRAYQIIIYLNGVFGLHHTYINNKKELHDFTSGWV